MAVLSIKATPQYVGVTTEINRVEFEIRGLGARAGVVRLYGRVSPLQLDIPEAVHIAREELLEDLADLQAAIAQGRFEIVQGR